MPPAPGCAARLRIAPEGDFFAVGVMLYGLLCNGENPYPGSLPLAGELVIDPRTFRPDLQSDLADLLGRACASYRSERFTTAHEMRVALDNVRNGRSSG